MVSRSLLDIIGAGPTVQEDPGVDSTKWTLSRTEFVARWWWSRRLDPHPGTGALSDRIGSRCQFASSIGRELEIKVREQEAFPNQEVMPDLGFIAFLRAFGESWLTKMSGPLTVPFTIAALIATKLLQGAIRRPCCGLRSVLFVPRVAQRPRSSETQRWSQ